MPRFSDNEDEMVRQLKAIRTLLGDGSLGGEVDLTSVKTPRRALEPGSYVTVESDEMDWSNEDGTVTVEPGDEVPLVKHYASGEQGVMLLAVGATDEQDVRYRAEVDDQRTVGGQTNSPLGVLNSPFSFVESLGGAIPANRSVAYYAKLDEDAPAPVDLVARLHVEEVSGQ